MITVVNGYVCTSACEAASAKQGNDPSAPPGAAQGNSDSKKASSYDGQPTTVLSGALKDLAAVSATTAVSGAPPAHKSSVNLLA